MSITIQDLSIEKNISKRSVYYDLCKINDWLQSYHIDLIVIERKKGIYLNDRLYNEVRHLEK